MSGKITLSKMQFYAHHGVMEQERRVGNDYEVTVELLYPIEAAAQSDNLADTLNYAQAYEVVAEEMAQPSQLLEHVAWRIARALRQRFPRVEGGRVAVTKLTPPFKSQMTGVTVEMEI